MIREGRESTARKPGPVTSHGPARVSAEVLAGVLERFAPPGRLTHDHGFHRRQIAALAAAFSGTHIVTGTADGNVRLWDAASGGCVRVFDCGGPTLSAIFTTPGTNRMVTAFVFGNKKVCPIIPAIPCTATTIISSAGRTGVSEAW